MNISLKGLAGKALVFDLDGTLLDTEPLYTIATQRVLDPYGATYTMELKKRCMGGSTLRTAEMTIAECNLPMTPDEFITTRNNFLGELFADAPEIAGAGQFIAAAAQLVPIGVATSSHQHLFDLKVGRKPWLGHLSAVVCGDDPAVAKGKPAPDIFLACAERLGIAAHDCIAFEDSPTGLKAARAAGMQVVGMMSPYVEMSDLGDADVIINDFTELATAP